MPPAIRHFLLVFDHSQAKLIHKQSFDFDLPAALTAYNEMEKQHRDNEDIDIVLVGSDSIETVQMTHANYFDGSAYLDKHRPASKYLAGL